MLGEMWGYEEDDDRPMRFGFPSAGCYFFVLPMLLLAARLVWEQTFLSWREGPQMVGFQLMHSALPLLLVVLVPLAIIWAIVAISWAVAPRRRRNLTNIAGAAAVFLSIGVSAIPYGTWVSLFSAKIAKGPHAAEFLVYMAVLDERSAVAALLDHGVPVNASNGRGMRAIEAAQNAKLPVMQAYLAERGGTDKRF